MTDRWSAFGLAAIFGTALSAISVQTAAAATTLENARESKSIVVGLANEKPYAYIETDGTVTGAIVDVLRAALAPLGIDKIEANVNEFSVLVPGVVARRFEIIGAGMYITPKRCQAVAFTNPITQIATALATRTGNPSHIHSLEDIAKSDSLKVGSQLGTAQVEDLHRAGIPEDRIVLFSRDIEALSGLQAGRVDAIYYPGLELNELIAKAASKDVERVDPFTVAKGEDGNPLLNFQAFGFNKEDADFVEAVNKQIDALRSSGKLAEILAPYGFAPQDIPNASITASQLCSGS